MPVGLQALTVAARLAAAGVCGVAVDRDWPAVQPRAGGAVGARVDCGSAPAARARERRQERAAPFRDGLVVLQVAATLVLLVAAGLMLRTLANLNAIELGFDADNLLTMQVPLPSRSMRNRVKRMAFFDRVVAGVRALPGVHAAAFGSTLPFQAPATRGSSPSRDGRFARRRAGRVVPRRHRRLSADARRGRWSRGGCSTRAMAPTRRLPSSSTKRWSGNSCRDRSALGRRIRFAPNEPWFTIVGVVKGRSRAWIRAGGEARCLRAPSHRPALQTANIVVRVDGTIRSAMRRPSSGSFGGSIPTSRSA